MSSGFQQTLDYIRSIADSEARKGRLFERLIKTFLQQDPLYEQRFSKVWLWAEWAHQQEGFDGQDTGIDLVAEERDGIGFCAIQCKCYAPATRISKRDLDSFIAASSRKEFSSRMMVDTGAAWGANATKLIEHVTPACTVLRFEDLKDRPIVWPDLLHHPPEDLLVRREPFRLRPHQQAALDDTVRGFAVESRGKLIMACGTGKTFTALRIAEAVAGAGRRVLYLVPSISLFQQTMREWAEQRRVPHRYVGICSDTRAGHTDEDATMQELEIPVTTDPDAICRALKSVPSDAMTVVFSTYHSLGLVEHAQNAGAPAFDLILCDEAHRTTGIERPGDARTSPFVLVHDAQRIRAAKRLYMTATPRLYTEGAKKKAANHSVEVFSMDDPATYGPEFHRLPFSRAVAQDLLSDYKVVILAMSEAYMGAPHQSYHVTSGGEINLSDAARILGCWGVLQNPEHTAPGEVPVRRLRRVIAFTNTIKSSKRLAFHWGGLVETAIVSLPETERAGALRCETRHVDGQHHALERKSRIDWLKGETPGTCRILSNARCLSEGIDVPALDAVMFMSPRNSPVEIVQAVGRAMRKAEGKEYGYIVLPVVVPAGVDGAEALNDNKRFAGVWSVLRALRAHDDRFNAEINKIDLNDRRPDRIIIKDNGNGIWRLPFPPVDLPPDALYARIVEKCGDRKYWGTWAKDVADIFSRLVQRIKALLDDPANNDLQEWFEAFHQELTVSINTSITTASAIDMMAQHILTLPVFKVLFEQYDFAAHNPVSQALDSLRKDFGDFGLEGETRDLAPFYESVRLRAQGLDNSEARQRVLMELYERFFATAMKKDADRLGIVYTPVEVVDFILASADRVLRDEFGRSLSDEGVHVLDPFTGTGIFLVRLLQSALIRGDDLVRKYREELHANEIVLLAYYIAAIHIEEAFHGRLDPDSAYEPFGGIVLTDTFNLHTGRAQFPKLWLPVNSARAERQQKLPIQVIVGNPPWSAGQRSAADDNPNVDYPELEKRIADTYAARSRSANKNSLYDTYKMAIRWASDRIGKQGIVALVTNGSWIDGNVDSGVRACLAEEFSSIYVLNLRGNQRTQGERSRQEGGKVFGQGSRAPVAITLLVCNPNDTDTDSGCRILYHDIGDYLKREEKLDILRQAESIADIEDWQTITPNRYHDWIGQRDPAFEGLYPMGTKDAKAGKADDAIFNIYSRGYETSRDAYLYNFSREACAENAGKMVDDYLGALQDFKDSRNHELVENIVRRHASNTRWDRELKNNLRRCKGVLYSTENVWATTYRPFVKQHCYVEYVLVKTKGQMDSIFPAVGSKNRAICVPGIGSTKPFSALVVDSMPDVQLMFNGQCFPRYRFPSAASGQSSLFGPKPKQDWIDNISETAWKAFRAHYHDPTITRDAIFDYIYGVLHAPAYRDRFADTLSRELPRIPYAPDFWAFADAGRELAELHLGYETGREYPLDMRHDHSADLRSEHFRIGTTKMKWGDADRTVLIVNDHIRLGGIPAEAHQYQVNGRTPVEWFIDRYHVKTDTRSGITNDPNGWFDDPADLITAFRRIVHVSVETVRIVAGLPEVFVDQGDRSLA